MGVYGNCRSSSGEAKYERIGVGGWDEGSLGWGGDWADFASLHACPHISINEGVPTGPCREGKWRASPRTKLLQTYCSPVAPPWKPGPLSLRFHTKVSPSLPGLQGRVW